MQIVTDSGMDMSRAQLNGIDIHVIPLIVNMSGTVYRSGVDIQPQDFYRLLEKSGEFPTTSQPSPADFIQLYESIAREDPEILSIHISSNLSGTYNSARLGAQEVPSANITLIDSKTVSGAQGWLVEAAARAVKAGWSLEEIRPLLKLISDNTDIMYTIATLRYLVHGGRINHLRGLVGSIMDIKPIIGIDKNEGMNAQLGTMRTLKKATLHQVELIKHQYEPGTPLRVQVLHGDNANGAELLSEHLDKTFKCDFLPTDSLAPVLGAHTGPGLVGVVYAPQSVFSNLPWERERPY